MPTQNLILTGTNSGGSIVSNVALTITTAAPLFDPATLFTGGRLGFFHDFSDLAHTWQGAGTTAAVANSPLGRVDDLSGNGWHLNQTVTGDRPTLRLGSGLYYGEMLASTGAGGRLVSTFADASIGDFLFVFGFKNVAPSGAYAFEIGGGGSWLAAHLPYASDGNAYFDTFDDSSARITGAWANPGDPTVVTWTRTGSAVNVRRNGVSFGNATYGAPITSVVYFRWRRDQGTAPNLYVACDFFRTGTWSTTDRTNVESHAAARIGVTLP